MEAVSAARRAVGTVAHVPEMLRWPAELVAGELLANGFRHGAPPVAIEVVVDGETVRIAVSDAGRTVGVPTEDSRGLRIVAALSDTWDVDFEPGGKTVWAVLTASSVHAIGAATAGLSGPPAGERATQGTEEWLARIYEHAPIGIAITGIDGSFERCNGAYCALVGYQESELRRIDEMSITHPDDRAASAAAKERLLAGGIPLFEIEHRYGHKLGRWIWVHKVVSVLQERGGGPAHVVSLVADITERKQWETQLAEKARLLDLASDAMLLRGPGDRIEFWNEAAERLFGYRRADAIGRVSHELLETEFPQRLDEIDRMLRQEGHWTGELVQRCRDGTRVTTLSRWLLDEVGPDEIRVLETDTDISDAKRIEARLRSSEERFRSTFEHAPVAIAHVALDGTILRFNRKLCEITGYRAEELAALPFQRVAPPGDLLGDQLLTERQQRGDIDRDTVETRARRRDGSVVWVNLTRSFVRHPADGEPYFIAVIEDISVRKRAEHVLRRSEAREREIALRLQQALLPESLVSHPAVALAARYEASSEALEVGGDWYDSYRLADGRLAFTVGDVVGHGLDAAAAMGRLRTATAALAKLCRGPAELLDELDDFARGPNGVSFATAAYAVLDPSSGELEFASAGHPPLLVAHPDATTEWLEGGRSAPLTVRARRRHGHARVRLGPGALLVMFSDGLIERRNESIDVGLARLEAAVRKRCRAPVEALCDAIVRELRGETRPADDVVLLCVRLGVAEPT